MSSLREVQAGFRAALLADDEREVAPAVVELEKYIRSLLVLAAPAFHKA